MGNKALLDASFLVALGNPLDLHASSAENIFKELVKEGYSFLTNNYLTAEAFTVILLRTKKLQQVTFFKENLLETYKDMILIYQTSSEFDKEVCKVLIGQKRYKGEFLSFADCSVVVQARKLGIKTLVTFDETFKQFASEFTIIGI